MGRGRDKFSAVDLGLNGKVAVVAAAVVTPAVRAERAALADTQVREARPGPLANTRTAMAAVRRTHGCGSCVAANSLP